MDPRYAIRAEPFVDGAAEELATSRVPRAALPGMMLGVCTRHRGAFRGAFRSRDSRAPERGVLLAALAAVDRPWTGGTFSEPARQALSDSTRYVLELLATYDRLAAQLDRLSAKVVVTHGEPHPGNLIHSPHGLRMVDWDTVAMAEPERDLWMTLDVDVTGWDEYRAVTGSARLNERALERYRERWAHGGAGMWPSYGGRTRRPRTPGSRGRSCPSTCREASSYAWTGVQVNTSTRMPSGSNAKNA
jgi:spectinomycin phosphotransferase